MRIAQKILRLEYIIQVNAGGLEIMGVVSDYEIVLGYFCHLISLGTFYSKNVSCFQTRQGSTAP